MNDNKGQLSSLLANLQHTVLGCQVQSEVLVVALLAHGHVLIQGAPGIGKTTLAKTIAGSLNCIFKRVQFTPDLLPADILGYSVYNQSTGNFHFHPGAIFTNVLLADEINRTTPRIQSALLEAMNENQVSIDGETRKLEAPFFVVATQNHIHQTGTFPLPESQLDRFIISFEMPHPEHATQVDILKLHLDDYEPCEHIKPVLCKKDLLAYQAEVLQVQLQDNVMDYIARLADATHQTRPFQHGVSPRASISLMRCSQAMAWLSGRDAVYPDDVKQMLPYVFSHRLFLRKSFQKSEEGIRKYLNDILDQIPVP